ncbi:MAG: DUF4193 family protein [Acidimicrobiia bacterium]
MSRTTPPDPPDDLATSGRERPEEIELLGDGEEIDATEKGWAPGEPSPGEPLDEILHVHPLTETEPPADLLEIPEDGLELPQPDEVEEVEEVEELETTLEATLPRTVLAGHDLETRYEEFDEEGAALAALQRPTAPGAPDEFVCSRCYLRKDRAQLADPKLRVCRDCAELGSRRPETA